MYFTFNWVDLGWVQYFKKEVFKSSIKTMKIGPKTSEEKLFIKTQQISQQKQYLSRFKKETRQKLNLSRSMKLEFPNRIFDPS